MEKNYNKNILGGYMKKSQFEVSFPLSNPKLPIMSNHNSLKISKEVPFGNLIFHACKKTQGFLRDLKSFLYKISK